MMIAIVILGLGLLMVATMFPVAWDRARTLSEYTIEQSVVPGAESTLEAVLRPTSARMTPIVPIPPGPPFEQILISSGSLAGDLVFDPFLVRNVVPAEAYRGIVLYSDTRVHALNLPNIKVSDSAVVDRKSVV